MISGKYYHQMDEKNRIRIPPECRLELGDTLYFMAGANGCLYVYPYEKGEEELRALMDKVDMYDPDDEYGQALTYLASIGFKAQPDKTGRVVLNRDLVRHAGITKNIVTVALVDRLQIWSEETWNDRFDLTAKKYDNILRKRKNGDVQKPDGDE